MMGEKLDDSHEKDIDESVTIPNAMNDSSSGQDDTNLNTSDRRILSAQHKQNPDGLLVRFLKVIFYIPMRLLSLVGISLWQNNLQVSGNAKIDKSPLRPASTSPQKRKREEGSPIELDDDDEIEDDDVGKILEEAVEGYESGEDKDFKPGDESSCSEEYTEGDTENELSKLSIEDVSEPRPSPYRNITEVDKELADKDAKEKKKVADAVPMPTKCIDEPVTKPELTPATVGVMG